ncbi:MAG: hypothetical protein QXK12_07225 [Candidatus Nezhaarchaeales archaeon]
MNGLVGKAIYVAFAQRSYASIDDHDGGSGINSNEENIKKLLPLNGLSRADLSLEKVAVLSSGNGLNRLAS